MDLGYDITGAGSPVLLLHSTACDRRMWDSQVPVLTDAGYRVLRCDLRGFGETPMPRRSFNNAQDVIELLDQLSIDGTAVIAASGGGQTALEVAARWPPRVTSLVLLASAATDHEPGDRLRAFVDAEDELIEAGDVVAATELNVETWLGPYADDEVRESVRQMQRNAFDLQLAADDEVDSFEVDIDVTAITAPTLLVSGEHDFSDFRDIAARLAREIPQARHLHLEWAGHLPSLERPDSLNPILVESLSA